MRGKIAVGVGTVAAIAMAVPAVKQFEGLWTTAQVDTIGTGRPITWCYGETEGPVKVGQKFTPKQCEDMLAAKLPRYNAEISKCIYVPISDKTRAAFISFAYNVGSAGFCRSSAASRLNAGDDRGACEALMLWTKAQGRVVRGLVNRRNVERRMCLEGLSEPKIGRVAAPTPKPRPDAAPPKPPEHKSWWRWFW